ncbi:hypothetical protein D3C85_1415170 [compost metagenome]
MVVPDVDDTSVTKNSSEPTLITAFWLFSVEIRGLDSTRTSPWVSSNWISPLKSPVLMVLLNTPPTPIGPVSATPARLVPISPPSSVQLIPAWKLSDS